jgi:DNA-binding CsgD family transcriptional regulator
MSKVGQNETEKQAQIMPKTMNDVPPSEAVAWFEEFLDPGGACAPTWFDEVGTRDFLECLKLYCDLRYGCYDAVVEEKREAIAQVQMPEEQLASLTPAELEVFSLICNNPGLAVEDIADKRQRSVGAVKAQISSIYKKLGVCRRSELLAKVNGLLETVPNPEPNGFSLTQVNRQQAAVNRIINKA